MSLFLFQADYISNENIALDISRQMTDVQEVNITLAEEVKNDNMTVVVKNDPVDVFSDGSLRHEWVNVDGTPIFKAIKTSSGEIIDDELIKIYCRYEDLDGTATVNSDDYLLFTGIIKEGKTASNADNHKITLKTVNRNSIILNKISIPQFFELTDAKTSPLIQQQLIRRGASGVQGNSLGFDTNGVQALGNPYFVDARTFSEGVVDSGTTTSAATKKLIQTGQNFQTTVSVGDWVRNTTTEQYAYVYSVDSDTQLTLTKDIMSSGDSYQISDGFIQDTRPDGTAFPSIAYSLSNKPLSEAIQELSQTSNTNSTAESNNDLVISRQGRFFIDIKNRYHWYVPDNTPEYYMSMGQTSAISPDTISHIVYEHDLANKIENEVNFIIYKAGEDMNNNQIEDGLRAPFSGSPEVKDSFRDFSNIARRMKSEDEKAGNISKTTGDIYSYPGAYNPLPSGQSYPAWDNIKSSIPTDDASYNAAFKAEAIRRANIKCRAIFNQQSNPRWSGTIKIRGEQIGIGDLINFTDKKQGIVNVKVRVIEVLHSINALTGWMSSIKVEQDEPEEVV